MSLKIEFLPNFIREVKQLRKKYPSIGADLDRLVVELADNPRLGVSLGRNCYKIRLAIKSKAVGKSGGARVITFVAQVAEKLTLLSIYDKSEQDSISDQQLTDWLQEAQG